jgi:hypothetical protein
MPIDPVNDSNDSPHLTRRMHVLGRREMNGGAEKLVQLEDEEETFGGGRNNAQKLQVDEGVRPDDVSDEEVSESEGSVGEGYDVGSSSGGESQPTHSILSPGRRTTSPKRAHFSNDVDRPATAGSSWYEFDLSVVVALVSPIGNWLTGGDHIKNLLLLLFLIFYLHQIIESEFLLFAGFCFCR